MSQNLVSEQKKQDVTDLNSQTYGILHSKAEERTWRSTRKNNSTCRPRQVRNRHASFMNPRKSQHRTVQNTWIWQKWYAIWTEHQAQNRTKKRKTKQQRRRNSIWFMPVRKDGEKSRAQCNSTHTAREKYAENKIIIIVLRMSKSMYLHQAIHGLYRE